VGGRGAIPEDGATRMIGAAAREGETLRGPLMPALFAATLIDFDLNAFGGHSGHGKRASFPLATQIPLTTIH
jgi:hypothetical protein